MGQSAQILLELQFPTSKWELREQGWVQSSALRVSFGLMQRVAWSLQLLSPEQSASHAELLFSGHIWEFRLSSV